MDAKWIYRVWEERNVLGVKATDEKMVWCLLFFIMFMEIEWPVPKTNMADKEWISEVYQVVSLIQWIFVQSFHFRYIPIIPPNIFIFFVLVEIKWSLYTSPSII